MVLNVVAWISCTAYEKFETFIEADPINEDASQK